MWTPLWNGRLEKTASLMLREALELQGMNFLLGKQSEQIVGGKRVAGLKFKDGSSTDADLIVMAVGIRPNVQLAKDAGIEIMQGIVVDDICGRMRPMYMLLGNAPSIAALLMALWRPCMNKVRF